jgi:hypothetical protein
MSPTRKAFLLCVGVVAIAYEKLAAPVQRHRERLAERFGFW